MKKNRIIYLILLSALLFMAACSDENEDATEEIEADSEVESTEEVADETLFSVLETNVSQLMEKNYEGYMNTVHTASPSYEATSETVEELFTYDLVIELSDLQVKEKSEEEALVAYRQRTIDSNDSDFEDNETIGEHVLRPEGEEWKIFHSEIIEVNVIEEEEPEIEEPHAEEVPLEGDYADQILELERPFENDDWVLVSYDENSGEARAEYIAPDENLGNYSEIITLEFYENGNELSNLAHFMSVFEWGLLEQVGDNLEFDRIEETASEVFYSFSVSGDEEQEDQHEIGRVFIKENHIYLARYTVIEENIENETEVYELLGEIN